MKAIALPAFASAGPEGDAQGLPPASATPVSAMPAHVRASAPADRAAAWRARRLRILALAFAFFSSARLVAYLPTVYAIAVSGKTDQHSLWTWATWTGANGVMAWWLWEHNGQRMDRAIAVTTGNATLCALISGLIVLHRWL